MANALAAPQASTAAPASAEPAVTPRVRPVVVQDSASVSADRGTRASTSDVPDTSAGAMDRPATKATGTSTASEPTRCSSCSATLKISWFPT